MSRTFEIFIDWACQGNPGEAAIGAVIKEDDNVLKTLSQSIGPATNNIAEYKALLATLTQAHKLAATQVNCFLDSQLVVKQMNREYKVKEPSLASIFIKIYNSAA